MVAAGNQFDKTSATVLDYVPTGKNNSKQRGQSTNLLKYGSLDMHGVIEKSGANSSYVEEMKVLIEKKNFTTHSDSNGKSIDTISSYAISKNLTNSLHFDYNDDSKSFAVFYVSPGEHTTKTWMLFPDYGIAIEVNKYVLITWDGSALRHCSCTGSDDGSKGYVYSLFTASKKDVSAYCKVTKSFKLSGRNTNLERGMTVHVRERLRNMKDKFNYIDPNRASHPAKFMYRQAKVLKVVDKQFVDIQFVGKLKCEKPYRVSTNHVCRKKI